MKHPALPTFRLALPCACALVLAALAAACSGANTAGTGATPGGDENQGGGDGAGGNLGGGTPGGQGGVESIAVTVGTSSTGGSANVCDVADDEDRDQDGITKAGGDCNDCDPNVNANAIEVIITEVDPDTGMPPEPADEDCDGEVDNVPATSCDDGIALDSADASDGARAIELCQQAPAQGGWGVISSGYTRGNGTPVASSLQFGIQPSFGANVSPQEGSAMLNLSSGHARVPGQPDACEGCGCSTNSNGNTPDNAQFPQTSPQCGGSQGGPGTQVHDDIAYEVRLRAPANATGFAFDFFFYTFEYPEFVCSPLGVNDQFLAWMQPAPAAAPNGNISFDAAGSPISVNAAFFSVCNECAAGPAQMAGTGFDTWGCNQAGGTGWLTTQAPVTGGQELTLRFTIFDSDDQIYDSSVLVDNFRWIASGGTVAVGTVPAPPPN